MKGVYSHCLTNTSQLPNLSCIKDGIPRKTVQIGDISLECFKKKYKENIDSTRKSTVWQKRIALLILKKKIKNGYDIADSWGAEEYLVKLRVMPEKIGLE